MLPLLNREQIAGFQHEEGAKALQGARALLDGGGVQYSVHTEVGWTDERKVVGQWSACFEPV